MRSNSAFLVNILSNIITTPILHVSYSCISQSLDTGLLLVCSSGANVHTVGVDDDSCTRLCSHYSVRATKQVVENGPSRGA